MNHVVIVGGGFAGLNCARKLSAHSDVRITLVDKNNYQQFQPLLYQVATAILTPGNAAFPLRPIFRNRANVNVKLGEVISADLVTRTVHTRDGNTYQGDWLVLAAGAQVNFFSIPGADKHAYPLYSLRDAELLRSRILMLLESVDREPLLVAKGALTFVVVGAGPTGTETAGALGDMTQRLLKDVYRDLPFSKSRVILIDAIHTVLNTFSQGSHIYASEMLKKHGVEVILGVGVQEVHPSHVVLSDGSTILTRTIIWAGGLKASQLSGALGIRTGRGDRIEVQPDFSVMDFPGVYALGDFANISGVDGKPLPQLASVAQQAGRYCADAIAASIAGDPVKPFRYVDKGIMAMIGRNAAVTELGEHRHELTGPFAFAAWLAVHALSLVSTRAKIETFIEWAWDYFGRTHVDPILDRPEEVAVDWTDADGDSVPQTKGPLF
jgi:NADH dehydrogenase